MKKSLIALLAATGLSGAACAQPAPTNGSAAVVQAAAQTALPDADPAMWVVRDEDTTIYLFGTFHLLDGKADWFNDEVRTAFDQSQELVFEVDMPSDPAKVAEAIGPLIVRYAVDPRGRTLSSRLSADQNRRLYEALAPLGVPAGAFDRMEPWFANMMLGAAAGIKLGLNPENGAETVLRKATEGRNMTIGQVETLESQIQMFDSMPEEQQLIALKETLDDIDSSGGMLPRMLAVWNSGDAEGLDRLMNEGMDDPQLRRIMLGARNEKWAEWIDERMDRPGTVFMAVGAGHLAGSDSVQSFLAQRNIRSQRVASEGGRAAPANYPACRSHAQDNCVQRGRR